MIQKHTITSIIMSKVLQVRIDADLKNKAEKVLEEMGMDLPTAIRVFLKKVIYTKSIPFNLSTRSLTENGFTPEFEDLILKASSENKNLKGFDSSNDLINFLNNSQDEDNPN
jgi:addiction module RelB/DinJ family antitoxin